MFFVERYALFIAPKKPLIDWVNYIFPPDKLGEVPVSKPLDHDHAQIFLIPEFNNIEEALEWLEENFDYFFQFELWRWCTDEALWPQERSWQLFQDWLHISIQSCLYDTLEGSIPKEEM